MTQNELAQIRAAMQDLIQDGKNFRIPPILQNMTSQFMLVQALQNSLKMAELESKVETLTELVKDALKAQKTAPKDTTK